MPVPERPLVLVIDDDPDIRHLIRGWLTTEAFYVFEAGDGPSALQMMQELHFDLLITDLRLPAPMDGVETVRRARANDPSLRSLFMSGAEGPRWHHPAYDDFMSKPINRGQLIGCVWELLYRH